MTIILNDKEIVLPSSLSDITLGQRISFHESYGKALDEMSATIEKMDEGEDKSLEIVNYNYEKMLRVFAFAIGEEYESVNQSEFIDVIATVYYSTLSTLFDDAEPKEAKRDFLFKGEQWILSLPELSNGSLMSFGEFIDAKQLVKDMIAGGKGKWQIVQYLAAIYLRKQAEPYKEEFLYENSERLKLMEELPMDIAQQVDFFLSDIMNSCMRTLIYFDRVGLRVEERIYDRTSICMVG